jgi:hypothetical protein
VQRTVSVGISDAMEQPKCLRFRELPSLVRLLFSNKPPVSRSKKVGELGFVALSTTRFGEVGDDWELGVLGGQSFPPFLTFFARQWFLLTNSQARWSSAARALNAKSPMRSAQ